MKLYSFWQNNSGGTFDGPAHIVLVQAKTAEKANERLLKFTDAYFDGCSAGIDCPCCGDRWTPVYGEPAFESVKEAVGHYEKFSNADTILLVLKKGELLWLKK